MILNIEIDRVEEWEQAFLDAMGEIEEVDKTYDHRPEEIESNSICLMFDDEIPGAQAMGKIERVEFSWIVQIYVHGDDRREMQKRMQRIILKMRKILRQNATLGGVLKKKPSLVSMGPIRVLRQSSGAALLKGYRLGIERETR